MKVLVTGECGFIGRKLVERLLERGHEVMGLDVTGPSLNEPPKYTSIRADLSSSHHVFDAVSTGAPEIIFHAGALLSAFAEADVLGAVTGNAFGTFNVLEAARVHGVPRVVFTSTIATYGRAAPEEVGDDSPQFPSSIYGVTKVFGERLGEYYHSRYPLDFRAIRFPSVIGPGRGDSGLSAYSSLMIEEPLAGRPFQVPLERSTAIPILYIDDAVRALLELSEASGANLTRRCYLVAGISPTASDIADAVKLVQPKAKITFRPDPASQAVVDSWPRGVDESEAARDWSWKSEFDLPAMVQSFHERIG